MTLKELYDNTDKTLWNMAVCSIIEKGVNYYHDLPYKEAKKSDADIIAKMISTNSYMNNNNLLIFLKSNGNNISYGRLLKIARNAISFILDEDMLVEFLIDFDIDLTEKEAELLNI